jgi:BirA family biotin operon repressor/biotin-[acetyl-CoA-carboxylase] ligase
MFQLEEFDIKLDTKFIGRNFIYADTLSSTNSYLLNSEKKYSDGTTLLAEFQENGRGRIQRPWQSTKGQNLTFSILLNKKLEKYVPNHINLAASLAVSQSIEHLYQLKTDLKWPNDVLIDKKKVSGILLESKSKGSSLEKIVIGIGINVNQTKFDGEFNIQPTSIKYEMRQIVNREILLSEILNTFEELLELSKQNSKKLLDIWRENCRMLGENVKIVHNGEIKYGNFYDIDANGFMILNVDNKMEKITIGDVSVIQK